RQLDEGKLIRPRDVALGPATGAVRARHRVTGRGIRLVGAFETPRPHQASFRRRSARTFAGFRLPETRSRTPRLEPVGRRPTDPIADSAGRVLARWIPLAHPRSLDRP